MHNLIDLHVHSIASGHAINTIDELVRYAAAKGLTHLGITDHGPSMVGAPQEGYFWISNKIPNKISNINILIGIEANIINVRGEIDLSDELLQTQGIVSAGIHNKTPYTGKTIDENTNAIVNAINSGVIDVITHPIRKEFLIDVEPVVEASIRKKVLLELNNQTFFKLDKIVINKYQEMVKLIKHENAFLIVGSDSHTHYTLGATDNIDYIANRIGLTPDIILNNYREMIERRFFI